MLEAIIHISIIIFSILFMEIVAIFSHKYIMHGPGWFLHKSHHSKNKGKFELNDMYFILFSLPSITSIISGVLLSNIYLISLGIGILCYGIIYILLHDVLVHDRLGIKIKSKLPYLQKIKKSHLKHHACKHKDGATNFGFITYK